MPELPEVQKIAKDTIEYIKKETALPAERRCRNDKAYHLISGCGCTLYACVKIPTCNFGQEGGTHPSITLTCSIRANENAKYDRNFYLDEIILDPVVKE